MNKIKLWLGIDRAIFFTLLARGWTIAGGLLTLIFVTRFLSPEMQGYYYTFNSLIALQIFVELGLTFVIIQFASHEMAALSWTPQGTVSGNPEAKRRLQSLMHFSMVWFGLGALLMIVVLLPTGIYFFKVADSKSINAPSVSGAWTLLVIFSACNLAITTVAAILEGCGKVAQIAVLRLWQSICSVIAAWIVLSFGGYLYALAISSLVTLLVNATWLWVKYRVFIKDLFKHTTHLPGMNWRQEIWPFQWRIALSWMSGYFIFQLFNPLLFATHGPIVAGQMGMSLQIMTAMNIAAMAWITTKVPTYGQLVATKQSKALDTLFFRGFAQSMIFLVFGVISVWLIFLHLSLTASPYAARVLSPQLFACLEGVCLANHIVFAEAAYLRAHKQEPFMVLSILIGAVTAVLALMLVPPFGAAGAVFSYASTAVLIGLGGGTVIFFRKRKEWAVNSIGLTIQ